MTDQVRGLVDLEGRLRWPPVLMAGGTLLAGFYLAQALSYSHDFADGLGAVGFYMIAIVPVFTLGYLAIAWSAARVLALIRPRANWGRLLVTAAAVFAVAIVAHAYVTSRPAARFEQWVLDPALLSVANLRMEKISSFGDGYAWFFAFDATPEVFEQIRRRHGLAEIPVDWRAREADLAELGAAADQVAVDAVFPEDRQMLEHRPLYVRPSGARFFRGDRIDAVADPSLRRVFIRFDRFDASE